MSINAEKLYKDQKKYLKQIDTHLKAMAKYQNAIKANMNTQREHRFRVLYKESERHYRNADEKLSKVEQELNQYKLDQHKEEIEESSKRSKPTNMRGRYSIRRKTSKETEIGDRIDFTRNAPNAKKLERPTSFRKVRKKTPEASSLYSTTAEKELKEESEQTVLLNKILKALNSSNKLNKDTDKKQNKQSILSSIFRRSSKESSGGGMMSMLGGLKGKMLMEGLKIAGIAIGGGTILYQLKNLLENSASQRETESGGKLSPTGDPIKDLMYFLKPQTIKKDINKSKDLASLDKLMPKKMLKYEGMGISKKFSETKSFDRFKDIIGKYDSYITEGYAESGHKGHKKGITVDLGTRQITQSNEDTETKIKLFSKFVMELFTRAKATKIIYEYSNDSDPDFVRLAKQLPQMFAKRGYKFIMIQTQGTGEHLDVKFDEKYAIKKKNNEASLSKAMRDGLEEENNPFLSAIGVPTKDYKKSLSSTLSKIGQHITGTRTKRQDLSTSGFWMNDISGKSSSSSVIDVSGKGTGGMGSRKGNKDAKSKHGFRNKDKNKGKYAYTSKKTNLPESDANAGISVTIGDYTSPVFDTGKYQIKKDNSLKKYKNIKKEEEKLKSQIKNNSQASINAPSISVPTTNNNDNKTIIINNNYDTKSMSNIHLYDVNAYS
jgi:hypothetical protein